MFLRLFAIRLVRSFILLIFLTFRFIRLIRLIIVKHSTAAVLSSYINIIYKNTGAPDITYIIATLYI